jgi:hypothetical protein
MARTAKPEKKVGGPFVAAALLCNSITEDSDGVLSAIRIVDEIHALVRSDAPPDFPSKDKPLDVTTWALIIIRRGDARAGKHKLRLVFERPDGTTDEAVNQDIELPKHPNGAANVKVKMSLKLFSSGVFWIDVVLDGKCLSRMALNLVILRPESTPANKP